MLGTILEVVIFDLLELVNTMCEVLGMAQREIFSKDHLSMIAVNSNIIEVNLLGNSFSLLLLVDLVILKLVFLLVALQFNRLRMHLTIRI